MKVANGAEVWKTSASHGPRNAYVPPLQSGASFAGSGLVPLPPTIVKVVGVWVTIPKLPPGVKSVPVKLTVHEPGANPSVKPITFALAGALITNPNIAAATTIALVICISQ